MSFSLIPDYSFKSLCDVTPEFLIQHGIKLLLLDLDNTMAPYGTIEPPREIAAWADDVRQHGVELFIITNNTGSKRVEGLAKAFGMDFIMRAKKPFASGVNRALKQLGRSREETALVGDQISTDVAAANSAGVTSIVVRPIKITNPALNLRYWLEAPFRALCRNKM
jgi:HAD superfamily phosphatase (TIGR01668 family)